MPTWILIRSGKISILLLLVEFIIAIKGSRLNLVDNGYEDVVIAIEPDVAERTDSSLISAIKATINETSHVLFTATNDRAYFRKVYILVPDSWKSTTADEAPVTFTNEDYDFLVAPKKDGHGNEPFTLQPGECGEPGEYIYAPPEFFTKKPWGSRGKTLVNEWAKYRWGVFDEQGYPEDPEYPIFYIDSKGKVQPNYCTNSPLVGTTVYSETNFSCINNPITGLPSDTCRFVPDLSASSPVISSLMSLDFIPSIVKFCNSSTHNSEAKTKQNAKCGGLSIWDVMMEHEDFRFFNNPPTMLAPDPEFKVVKMSKPSYCIVIDQSASMGEVRGFERTRRAIATWVRYEVGMGSRVAIVSFNTEAEVLHPLTEIVDETSRAGVVNSLSLTTSEVGSCTICGLQKAVELLAGKTNSLIILIHASVEERATLESVEYITSNYDSKVNIIYLGFDFENDYINALKGSTGNRLFIIPSDDIGPLFDEALRSSLSSKEKDSHATKIVSEVQDIRFGIKNSGSFLVDSSLTSNLRVTIQTNDPESSSGFEKLIGPNGEPPGIIFLKYMKAVHFFVPKAEEGIWKWELEYKTVIPKPKLSVEVFASPTDPTTPPISVNNWAVVTSPDDETDQKLYFFSEVKQGNFPVIEAQANVKLTTLDNVLTVQRQLLDNGLNADVMKDDGIYSVVLNFDEFPVYEEYSSIFTVEGNSATKIVKRSTPNLRKEMEKKNVMASIQKDRSAQEYFTGDNSDSSSWTLSGRFKRQATAATTAQVSNSSSNATTVASNSTTVASNSTTVASNSTTVASNSTTVASNSTTVASNSTTVASNSTTVASNLTTVSDTTTTSSVVTTTSPAETTTTTAPTTKVKGGPLGGILGGLIANTTTSETTTVSTVASNSTTTTVSTDSTTTGTTTTGTGATTTGTGATTTGTGATTTGTGASTTGTTTTGTGATTTGTSATTTGTGATTTVLGLTTTGPTTTGTGATTTGTGATTTVSNLTTTSPTTTGPTTTGPTTTGPTTTGPTTTVTDTSTATGSTTTGTGSTITVISTTTTGTGTTTTGTNTTGTGATTSGTGATTTGTGATTTVSGLTTTGPTTTGTGTTTTGTDTTTMAAGATTTGAGVTTTGTGSTTTGTGSTTTGTGATTTGTGSTTTGTDSTTTGTGSTTTGTGSTTTGTGGSTTTGTGTTTTGNGSTTTGTGSTTTGTGSTTTGTGSTTTGTDTTTTGTGTTTTGTGSTTTGTGSTTTGTGSTTTGTGSTTTGTGSTTTGTGATSTGITGVSTSTIAPLTTTPFSIASLKTNNDTIPPATITDVQATAITSTGVNITWTATGDDGMIGKATAYEILISTNQSDVQCSNQSNCSPNAIVVSYLTSVNVQSMNKTSGQPISVYYNFPSSLLSNVSYYVTVIPLDDSGNYGNLSNVANFVYAPPPATTPAPTVDNYTYFVGTIWPVLSTILQYSLSVVYDLLYGVVVGSTAGVFALAGFAMYIGIFKDGDLEQGRPPRNTTFVGDISGLLNLKDPPQYYFPVEDIPEPRRRFSPKNRNEDNLSDIQGVSCLQGADPDDTIFVWSPFIGFDYDGNILPN